jgi:ATP-binding cassette, subfamily B, multidrug efflux pump
MRADQVIVVDNGEIVGTGDHESLLADCAAYAEFAASQSASSVGGAQ